jgi:hypothetical protein
VRANSSLVPFTASAQNNTQSDCRILAHRNGGLSNALGNNRGRAAKLTEGLQRGLVFFQVIKSFVQRIGCTHKKHTISLPSSLLTAF